MIITVRSDIGAGFRGSDQGITALLDLFDKSNISNHVKKKIALFLMQKALPPSMQRTLKKYFISAKRSVARFVIR